MSRTKRHCWLALEIVAHQEGPRKVLDLSNPPLSCFRLLVWIDQGRAASTCFESLCIVPLYDDLVHSLALIYFFTSS